MKFRHISAFVPADKELACESKVSSADALYYSVKIPFAFNYSTGDTKVTTGSIHGTHAAGIAGGNNGIDKNGIPRFSAKNFRISKKEDLHVQYYRSIQCKI